MNKEDILARSKQENKNGDEKYLHNHRLSFAVGGSMAMLLAIVLSYTEKEVFGRSSTALWIVYSGTGFSVTLVNFILSRKKWLLVPLLAFGCTMIGLTVLYALGR